MNIQKEKEIGLSKSPRSQSTFADLFAESTLEGMRRTLGEHGSKTVILHSNLSQIFADSISLHVKFTSMFGESGAKRLEQVIISDLYLRLGMPYRSDDPINDMNTFDFEKCTTYANRLFDEEKQVVAARQNVVACPRKTRSLEKCNYIEFFFISDQRREHHCDLHEGHLQEHKCDQGRKIGAHVPELD